MFHTTLVVLCLALATTSQAGVLRSKSDILSTGDVCALAERIAPGCEDNLNDDYLVNKSKLFRKALKEETIGEGAFCAFSFIIEEWKKSAGVGYQDKAEIVKIEKFCANIDVHSINIWYTKNALVAGNFSDFHFVRTSMKKLGNPMQQCDFYQTVVIKRLGDFSNDEKKEANGWFDACSQSKTAVVGTTEKPHVRLPIDLPRSHTRKRTQKKSSTTTPSGASTWEDLTRDEWKKLAIIALIVLAVIVGFSAILGVVCCCIVFTAEKSPTPPSPPSPKNEIKSVNNRPLTPAVNLPNLPNPEKSTKSSRNSRSQRSVNSDSTRSSKSSRLTISSRSTSQIPTSHL